MSGGKPVDCKSSWCWQILVNFPGSFDSNDMHGKVLDMSYIKQKKYKLLESLGRKGYFGMTVFRSADSNHNPIYYGLNLGYSVK